MLKRRKIQKARVYLKRINALVGNKLTTDFLKKYLKKEEVQNDLKHPVSFKGNDEDFAVLTDWLAALKKQEAADTLKSK